MSRQIVAKLEGEFVYVPASIFAEMGDTQRACALAALILKTEEFFKRRTQPT